MFDCEPAALSPGAGRAPEAGRPAAERSFSDASSCRARRRPAAPRAGWRSDARSMRPAARPRHRKGRRPCPPAAARPAGGGVKGDFPFHANSVSLTSRSRDCGRRRSSVVERILGKAEVGSSILPGGTSPVHDLGPMPEPRQTSDERRAPARLVATIGRPLERPSGSRRRQCVVIGAGRRHRLRSTHDPVDRDVDLRAGDRNSVLRHGPHQKECRHLHRGGSEAEPCRTFIDDKAVYERSRQ